MPLHRRLPKRGFTNIFRKTHRIVNVERLNEFEAGLGGDPRSMLEAVCSRRAATRSRCWATASSRSR